MWQFISVAAAFIFLPVLIQKCKMKFGAALFVTGGLINLLARVPPRDILSAAVAVFTTYSSMHTIICVLLVGVLGGLLKNYGFLERVVILLKRLIRSKKLLICSIPCVIGILAVPGGAVLSAPFVDELGKDLDIEPVNRVAINLSFRHLSMFLYPFSNMLLYTSAIVTGISISGLIGLNFVFALVMAVVAYRLYMPHGKAIPGNEDNGGKSKIQNLKSLAFYSMPIYIVLVINVLFKIPPAAALAISVLLTCLICDRKNLAPVLLKGINLDVAAMIAGVFFIQNTMKNLNQINEIYLRLFQNSSGIVVLLTIAAGALSSGFVTGLSLVPLGIFLPILVTMPISHTEMMIYAFFIFVWSFMGYYFSPLHLCQLMTVQYMGIKTSDIYKAHLRLIPWFAAASFALFFIYRFLLLR